MARIASVLLLSVLSLALVLGTSPETETPSALFIFGSSEYLLKSSLQKLKFHLNVLVFSLKMEGSRSFDDVCAALGAASSLVLVEIHIIQYDNQQESLHSYIKTLNSTSKLARLASKGSEAYNGYFSGLTQETLKGCMADSARISVNQYETLSSLEEQARKFSPKFSSEFGKTLQVMLVEHKTETRMLEDEEDTDSTSYTFGSATVFGVLLAVFLMIVTYIGVGVTMAINAPIAFPKENFKYGKEYI